MKNTTITTIAIFMLLNSSCHTKRQEVSSIQSKTLTYDTTRHASGTTAINSQSFMIDTTFYTERIEVQKDTTNNKQIVNKTILKVHKRAISSQKTDTTSTLSKDKMETNEYNISTEKNTKSSSIPTTSILSLIPIILLIFFIIKKL